MRIFAGPGVLGPRESGKLMAGHSILFSKLARERFAAIRLSTTAPQFTQRHIASERPSLSRRSDDRSTTMNPLHRGQRMFISTSINVCRLLGLVAAALLPHPVGVP